MIFALLSKNVAIRIYARMSGIGSGGGEGGEVNPILAMPGFWEQFGSHLLPNSCVEWTPLFLRQVFRFLSRLSDGIRRKN